jgi:hypothetical protein
MTEQRSSTWKWWLLVVGLAFAHVVLLMVGEAMLSPGIVDNLRRPRPLPSLFYYPFMYVFGFPATLIFRIARPEPRNILIPPILILTWLFWGCIWAEPFRRAYSWQPWRFTVRDLLIVTTTIAAIFGLLVWLQ